MKKLLVMEPVKKRIVLCGYIDGDTFLREVDSTKHFMKIIGGYGIQEQAFDELKRRLVKNVLLKETDTGKNWVSSVDDWINHGRVADYGHGPQRFLSMKYMLIVMKGGDINENS